MSDNLLIEVIEKLEAHGIDQDLLLSRVEELGEEELNTLKALLS